MQANIISIHSVPDSKMVSGVVKSAANDVFIVQSSEGLVTASQAASCLLRPELDDKVLLSFIDNEIYVLAVLIKDNNKSKLSFKGDVVFDTQGELSINSVKKLTLNSSEKISQSAPGISALSSEHTIHADTFSANCTNMSLHSEQVQAQVKELHGMFERVYQKADQVIRWVETIETLNIGNWVQNVKHTLNSRAQNQIITAKSDVKVDAQRIHMG
jgi:hypothetical protein